MDEIAAIETRYKGHIFRSRLEARWAAFFDLVGWPWTYEPIDLDGYIPDFILQFHKPLLVEVKPALSVEELFAYTDKIDQSGWEHKAMIVGASPFYGIEVAAVALGLIRQWYDHLVCDPEWCWARAIAFRCRNCRYLSIHHEEGCWACTVRGCYEGDHFLGQVDVDEIHCLWGNAHSLTRWSPQ